MVIYNTPTRLAGCGLCGADDDLAPVLPPESEEIAVAANPDSVPEIPKAITVFDQPFATVPSWLIGVGIGVVALGVVAGIYAISRRV